MKTFPDTLSDAQEYEGRGTAATDYLIDSPNPKGASKRNGLKLTLKNGYKEIHSKSNESLVKTPKETDKKISKSTPPISPTNDSWFRTWPEREKTKTPDSSPSKPNTHNAKLCDINVNKLTLNEALKNISLAYSPVTKQLHLVEQQTNKEDKPQEDEKYVKTHRRIVDGSFSSTISTISNPSTSGSLLESDDQSLTSFDDGDHKTRKKSLTDFFTRNVFSWKNAGGDFHNTNSSSVWKLFSRNTNSSGSPSHVVVSSSALIQHKRPSNLPAKTSEEEQRHTDEYNAILAAAKKKEAKTSAAKHKQQKIQLQQEEQQAAATKHFMQAVLPKWDTMQKHRKTQELWWHGLPSSVRGKVWKLSIGNELNITQQLYDICLSRAQTRLNSTEPPPPPRDLEKDHESSMDVIELDISRTFPNLCIFQQGGPYSDVLHSLLAAYVCFRPDVGYVQGMSYIAAVLILNMEPYDAFTCFANLLNQPLHLSAFTLNQAQMQAYYNAYNEVFNHNLPKLYGHFECSGLTPDLYLLDWIYTVFAKAMPLDVACRVWDVFLRDGYEFVFRTALGILHLYQNTLVKMDFLHGAQFLTKLPEDLPSDQLFKSIQSVTTSIGKQGFDQIVEKCGAALSESYR